MHNLPGTQGLHKRLAQFYDVRMALYDPFRPKAFPSYYVLREEEDEYRWVIHRHREAEGWTDILKSPAVYESWMEANEEGAEALLNLIRIGDL